MTKGLLWPRLLRRHLFSEMLLFAAHDPGANNLLRPIYDRAQAANQSCVFVNLRKEQAPFDSIPPKTKVVFVGASTNQCELEIIRAARAHGGIRIIQATLNDYWA